MRRSLKLQRKESYEETNVAICELEKTNSIKDAL